jgi:hypothetical protein
VKAGISPDPRAPSRRPHLSLSGHDAIIKDMNKPETYPILVCTPKALPRNLRVSAAAQAVRINPVNHPPVERMMSVMPDFRLEEKDFLAVLTTKYWQARGVKLTVGFMDSPPAALKKRILLHMNAWDKTGNVRFTASAAEPQVRIARLEGRDGGYWSYLGTDILSIPAREPTMNLEGFTMETPESEFHRVVRHETGHTLGFPHEHVRRALIALIDARKAIEYFKRTQGWSAEEVRAQVLTPIEESSLLGTEKADPRSIMCYQIPGEITRSGKPIPGGDDINASDYEFIAKIYPKPGARKKKRA